MKLLFSKGETIAHGSIDLLVFKLKFDMQLQCFETLICVEQETVSPLYMWNDSKRCPYGDIKVLYAFNETLQSSKGNETFLILLLSCDVSITICRWSSDQTNTLKLHELEVTSFL